MGLVTGLAIAGAVIGAAGGVSKMVSGGKRKRAMKKAIKRFNRERQEFSNAHKDRGISTKGADIAREELQRSSATALETLASGGIRGAVGGVGAVQSANTESARKIGAGIDEQVINLEKDVARDEVRIQTAQEQREQREQELLYGQLNAAQQDQASGLGDISQSAFGAASIAGNAELAKAGIDKTPYVSKLKLGTQPLKVNEYTPPPVFTGRPQ